MPSRNFQMTSGNVAAPVLRDAAIPGGNPLVAPATGFGSDMATTPGPREDWFTTWLQGLLGAGPATSPQQANIAGILAGEHAMPGRFLRNTRRAARRQFQRDQGDIQESFGRMGARFGTDLADAQTRAAGDFRAGLRQQNAGLRLQLAQDAKNRSLQALNTLLGGAQFTTGLEFTRSQAGAQGAIEKIIQELRNQGMIDVAEIQADASLDSNLLNSLLGL